MQAKHTPGPWKATGYKQLVVNGSDGVTLAMHPGTGSLETVQANARLIAAAPDLLAALVAVYEACQTKDYRDPLTHAAIADIARAPIARATGVQ